MVILIYIGSDFEMAVDMVEGAALESNGFFLTASE